MYICLCAICILPIVEADIEPSFKMHVDYDYSTKKPKRAQHRSSASTTIIIAICILCALCKYSDNNHTIIQLQLRFVGKERIETHHELLRSTCTSIYTLYNYFNWTICEYILKLQRLATSSYIPKHSDALLFT